ncbi:MAG TPA: hypothetical protein VK524_05095 [Polyangiaceae bacterium]|nr:hypothetical protein [Polyangiaceae bacterium]
MKQTLFAVVRLAPWRASFKRTCVFTAALATAALSSFPAHAQPFATPADEPTLATGSPYSDEGDPRLYAAEDERSLPESTVRLHVGPGLRISESEPYAGLFAAVDVGRHAAGARVSGSWVRVGSAGGLSQYTGELWIDFAHRSDLHPILGAGAGVARLENATEESGETRTGTVGVGVLRGALEYVLPVQSTDARAGLEVIGSVPAIRSSETEDARAWLLIVATVGVGF